MNTCYTINEFIHKSNKEDVTIHGVHHMVFQIDLGLRHSPTDLPALQSSLATVTGDADDLEVRFRRQTVKPDKNTIDTCCPATKTDARQR